MMVRPPFAKPRVIYDGTVADCADLMGPAYNLLFKVRQLCTTAGVPVFAMTQRLASGAVVSAAVVGGQDVITVTPAARVTDEEVKKTEPWALTGFIGTPADAANPLGFPIPDGKFSADLFLQTQILTGKVEVNTPLRAGTTNWVSGDKCVSFYGPSGGRYAIVNSTPNAARDGVYLLGAWVPADFVIYGAAEVGGDLVAATVVDGSNGYDAVAFYTAKSPRMQLETALQSGAVIREAASVWTHLRTVDLDPTAVGDFSLNYPLHFSPSGHAVATLLPGFEQPGGDVPDRVLVVHADGAYELSSSHELIYSEAPTIFFGAAKLNPVIAVDWTPAGDVTVLRQAITASTGQSSDVVDHSAQVVYRNADDCSVNQTPTHDFHRRDWGYAASVSLYQDEALLMTHSASIAGSAVDGWADVCTPNPDDYWTDENGVRHYNVYHGLDYRTYSGVSDSEDVVLLADADLRWGYLLLQKLEYRVSGYSAPEHGGAYPVAAITEAMELWRGSVRVSRVAELLTRTVDSGSIFNENWGRAPYSPNVALATAATHWLAVRGDEHYLLSFPLPDASESHNTHRVAGRFGQRTFFKTDISPTAGDDYRLDPIRAV